MAVQYRTRLAQYWFNSGTINVDDDDDDDNNNNNNNIDSYSAIAP